MKARRRCSARFEIALRRHPPQCPARQLGDRAAHLQQLVREAEQLDVAPVPCDQPQLRIDHADALAHVLQRGFEHALVEAQVVRGFADDGGDGVEVAPLAARAPHRAARAPMPSRARRPVRARSALRSAPAPARRAARPAAAARTRSRGRKRRPASRSVCDVEAAVGAMRRLAAPQRRQHRGQRADEQAGADRTAERLQPVRPNSASGASQCRPNGPLSSHGAVAPRTSHRHRQQQHPGPGGEARDDADHRRARPASAAATPRSTAPAPASPARRTTPRRRRPAHRCRRSGGCRPRPAA